MLKPLRGMGTSQEAAQLAEEIRRRMPECTLIQILARTAYWLGRWRHFGPASGSAPKLQDPQGRYVLTMFACGSNMAPTRPPGTTRGSARMRSPWPRTGTPASSS
ncbi:hypothetical protein [Actinomadura nitritigenes]|uniref:Tn3 transposase DDE domain-containing protein n=1 Tax=Actinomadura nitritigenes TaxID=134602 RepID=A0ABS3RE68_9ACTN|nr:hypothetical protein [Actinomadura nitritigenes]